MSKFYYAENEILSPAWKPPAAKGAPKWLIALLVACLALAAYLLWQRSYGPEGNVMRATVYIEVDADGDGKVDGSGSGVVINPKGYVLTNRHVYYLGAGTAAKPAKVTVHFRSGFKDRQSMEATLERAGEGTIDTAKSDIRNDWAVLRVSTREKLPAVPVLDKDDFKEDEAIRAYGYPRGRETQTSSLGPQAKMVRGELNRVDRSAQGGVVRLTHSASTAEGMSGGPVTQRGALVGLNTQVLAGGAVTANENYALPLYLLKEPVFKIYGAIRK